MKSSEDPLLGNRGLAVRPGGVSTALTLLSLVKAYLGTGLLAMPYAARCAGLWVCVAGVLFLAFISNHTLKLLIEMKRHILADKAHQLLPPGGGDDPGGRSSDVDDAEVTYEDIGEAALGKWGRRLATVAMVVTNMGISIGYIVFCADTLLDTVNVASGGGNVTEQLDASLDPGTGGPLRFNLLTLTFLPLVGGLGLLRSMRRLAFVSMVGNVAIMSAICVVMYYSIDRISLDGFGEVAPARIETLPLFFGITMFGFTLHGVVLPLEGSMSQPAHVHRVLTAGVVMVALIYSAFAAFGYSAFSNSTSNNILHNLPADTAVDRALRCMTGTLLCLSMLFTIPLYNFAVFRVVEGSIWGKEPRPSPVAGGGGLRSGDMVGAALLSPLPRSASEAAERSARSRRHIQQGALRLAIVTVCIAVALAMGPLFAEIIGLVGAFSMSFLAFILPPAFHIRIERLKARSRDAGRSSCSWAVAGSWSILIFGVVAMTIATYVSIMDIVAFFGTGKEASC